MAVRTITYPSGTRFFGRGDEICRGTKWPITVFLVCGHNVQCKHEDILGKERQKRTRFGAIFSGPPPGTRGALGVEGVRPAHLGQVARRGQPRRMLDLFCGTGSVGDVYRNLGYQLTSVDIDPQWRPDICVDVLEWDFQKEFRPGDFEVVVCGVPCTEFSIALMSRPRILTLEE
jgi:hypothetical protein